MAKSKSTTEKKRMKKSDMLTRIVNFFNQDKNRAFNYKQVAHGIEATTMPQKQQVILLLEGLTEQDFLIEVVPGKYKVKNRGTQVTARFERRSNGKNHAITDENVSIFIPERNSLRAMNGDMVLVLVYAKRKNRETEGEVIEILEKNEQVFIGTLDVQKHFAFLLTDNKVLANDIFIPKDKLKGGKHGDKAVVRITDWPERARNPYGEVVDILGAAGENNTEINAIMAEYGLPYKYPENIEKAANKIPEEIPQEEIRNREDFRDATTFTIDPKDAKDFDDALSIRRLGNGTWEIGVHIADVTYYVKPNTVIEKEAEKRATSVYLVDRVVPMLPERLCNFICSLRPDEDKLAFSCIFEMNDKAEVLRSRIARTVIRSNRRYAYEDAQAIIETGEGDYKEEILKLNDLAQQLRANRFAGGSIDFDRHEVKFEIDETGRPLGVYFKVSKEANKLIEEFMLLANRTVAETIGKIKGRKPKAFVYRVHEQPDPDKLNTLSEFITRFGYKLKTTGKNTELSKGINTLLRQVKNKPEENLIETITLRSMAKAVYTTENVGHYGLAFDYYTHFTSPIRRYPDMMVHRLLEKYLFQNGKSVNLEKLEEECKHSSEMEQLAANAERASIKYKQV